MATFQDLTGQRFGKLTVLERGNGKPRADGGGQVYSTWIVQCDCGRVTEYRGIYLKAGRAISCGCQNRAIRAQRQFTPDEIAQRNEYHDFVRHAHKKGRDTDLTLEEFISISQLPCDYCGQPPSRKSMAGRGGEFTFSGLDRIDSRLGYTKEKVVPCCKRCNVMKNDQPLEEFLERISRIYHNKIKE